MKTKINKKRVVIAMSGGVDSSVAAALLKDDGYEVIGITMCLNVSGGQKKPSCCGIDGIEDAKKVAGKLNIPHYVLNFAKVLEEKIIRDFCLEYLRGRTPNPCIRCNRYLKFEALLDKARGLSADYLATGHYARIAFEKKHRRHLLKQGRDRNKDQSYFLYSIRKDILPRILFPLGNLTKDGVRELAKEFKLPVADKPGSQEVCFISDDYREFLKSQIGRVIGRHLPRTMQPGKIRNKNGEVLGQHQGVAFYTIGQREGLGIALGYPAYVIEINSRQNTLIVGKEEDIYSRGAVVKELNWLADFNLTKNIEVKVKIRYNHREVASRIIPLVNKRVRLIFSRPQRAVTPGQAAVFYRGEVVLGGGVIEKASAIKLL